MVSMPCDHHPITSQLGLTYNTLLLVLKETQKWAARGFYGFITDSYTDSDSKRFGKVIRVGLNSFNSSESFPCRFFRADFVRISFTSAQLNLTSTFE